MWQTHRQNTLIRRGSSPQKHPNSQKNPDYLKNPRKNSKNPQNPEKKIKNIIQVCGTNAKFSICSALREIFETGGYNQGDVHHLGGGELVHPGFKRRRSRLPGEHEMENEELELEKFPGKPIVGCDSIPGLGWSRVWWKPDKVHFSFSAPPNLLVWICHSFIIIREVLILTLSIFIAL